MKKLLLALAFAGASQGSFLFCTNGSHPFTAGIESVGELCASAPSDSTVPSTIAILPSLRIWLFQMDLSPITSYSVA